MARSAEHLARLEIAVSTLWSEEAKQRARQLDATLEPLSVHWGEDDGEPYIEWWGGDAMNYVVRLHNF